MGGYDGWKLTEKLIESARATTATVVVGPNFGRTIETPDANLIVAPTHTEMLDLLNDHQNVICGWGQTTFEALALGCRVVSVVQSNEHADEASIYGLPYVTRGNISKAWTELEHQYIGCPTMKPPLYGVEHVVDFMEDHCQY